MIKIDAEALKRELEASMKEFLSYSTPKRQAGEHAVEEMVPILVASAVVDAWRDALRKADEVSGGDSLKEFQEGVQLIRKAFKLERAEDHVRDMRIKSLTRNQEPS